MATRPAPLIGAPPTLAGFDAEETIAQIAATLRGQVWNALRRRGLVVGMSGGIDSSVCAALAVEALGRESVLALMMPEADSEPESLASATEWAETLRIAHVVEDVTGALESLGCYRRRDEAVRRVVPEYGGGWRCKLVTGPGTGRLRGLSVHQLVVESPQGRTQRVRLDPLTYREIVAATNFKQRVRKTLEYHHADRLHYAVMGTPNRLEYDQGFFVKGGDGLADVKPIAHLYKTQVYELAVALGVPERTIRRPPTTDTYPLEQKQDEFYFRLPIEVLDGLLWACNSGMAPEEASHELGLPLDEVERAYAEIGGKRRATRYLHLGPLLAGGVPEVEQGSGARR